MVAGGQKIGFVGDAGFGQSLGQRFGSQICGTVEVDDAVNRDRLHVG